MSWYIGKPGTHLYFPFQLLGAGWVGSELSVYPPQSVVVVPDHWAQSNRVWSELPVYPPQSVVVVTDYWAQSVSVWSCLVRVASVSTSVGGSCS